MQSLNVKETAAFSLSKAPEWRLTGLENTQERSEACPETSEGAGPPEHGQRHPGGRGPGGTKEEPALATSPLPPGHGM